MDIEQQAIARLQEAAQMTMQIYEKPLNCRPIYRSVSKILEKFFKKVSLKLLNFPESSRVYK